MTPPEVGSSTELNRATMDKFRRFAVVFSVKLSTICDESGELDGGFNTADLKETGMLLSELDR